jgi:chromosome partitioning protein
MKIAAIANQKGGVGKTTTAVHLAFGLALLPTPRSVLLLDFDPQGQVALACGMMPEPGLYNWLADGVPLAEVVRATKQLGVDLIPGSKRSAAIRGVLESEGQSLLRVLAERLKARAFGRYDLAVIDTPPGVGGLQEAALSVADWVVIPTACDSAALDGVAEVVKTMEAINQNLGGRARLVGILPTFHDGTNETLANLVTLQTGPLAALVMAPVRRRAAFREAWARGETIWTYAPRSDGAHDYAPLVHLVRSLL